MQEMNLWYMRYLMNLNLMKRIASKSPHDKYQHCTLIFAGSRLIATGYNTKDRHSEIVAIRKLEAWLRNSNTQRPKNLHLVNMMVRKNTGKFGNSKPCDDCWKAIRIALINRVTFVTEKGYVIQV